MTMRTLHLGIVVLVLAVSAPVAWSHGDDDHEPPAAATPAEEAAYQAAKPVFDHYCVACHTTGGAKHDDMALTHLNMDSYPFGGHHGAMAGGAVREVLAIGGGKPTMPKDHPGAVQGDDLALVAAWAAAFDAAHPDAPQHEGDDDGMEGMDHKPAGMEGMEGMDHGSGHAANHDAVPRHEAQFAYAVPRETLIPGRPGMSGFHFMLNGFAYLLNPGLSNHDITNAGTTWEGGRSHPLLTDDWAMGYWKQEHGWVEALVMINFEPLTVGKGGYPELGQSGEGLVDAQHSHQLVHQAMIAVHPLAGLGMPELDLAIFGGQGSATIGPPIFMHRASSPGPTVARKHHKGENPHETFPVLGASLHFHDLWVEGSAFSALELTPDDSRFYPQAAAPVSFAARVRYDVGGWGELQLSGERLRDQAKDSPDAWQASASAYFYGSCHGWRLDGLVDYAADVPDDQATTHGALIELAVRNPDRRTTTWMRSELNQREVDGASHPAWFFQTVGAEHVFAASSTSGLQVGFFAEATLAHVPDDLQSVYGQANAVTVSVGLHLFGMWMLDGGFRRMTHDHESDGGMAAMPGM
jgi:hypothetical protein